MSKKEVMPERIQDLIERFKGAAITLEELTELIKEEGFELTYKLDEEGHTLLLTPSISSEP